jgi:hypothetical protein
METLFLRRNLLSVCSVMSIFVSSAIILANFQSIVGSASDIIMDHLPCNIEALMAIDLVFATAVLGLLIFERSEQLT